jgi:hypothetical protein
VRFALVAVFLAYFVFSAYFALQLEPPVTKEEWFPSSHMITRRQDADAKFYGGDQAEYLGVSMAWGIEGVDRSNLDRWQPSDRGEAVWDAAFDPSSAAAQAFLLGTCAELRGKTCSANGCMDGSGMLVRRNADGTANVKCFFDDWHAWFSAQSGAVGLLPLADLPSGEPYIASLKAFRASGYAWPFLIGVVDGVLRYVTIEMETTLEKDQPQSSVLPVYDIFMDVMETLNTAAPEGMGRGFATQMMIEGERGAWTWAMTQQGLVDTIFTGFAICFPAAFLTLVRPWAVKPFSCRLLYVIPTG